MDGIDVEQDWEAEGNWGEVEELKYREEGEACRQEERKTESPGVLDTLRRFAGRWVPNTDEDLSFLQTHLKSPFPPSLDSNYRFHCLLKSPGYRKHYVSLLAQCRKQVSEHITGQIHVLVHECVRNKEAQELLEVLNILRKIGVKTEWMQGWTEWNEPWFWQYAAEVSPSPYLLQSTMEDLGLNPDFIRYNMWRKCPRASFPVAQYRKEEIGSRGTPKWLEELDARSSTHARPLMFSQSIPSLQTEEEDLEPELSTTPLEHIPVTSKSGDDTSIPHHLL